MATLTVHVKVKETPFDLSLDEANTLHAELVEILPKMNFTRKEGGNGKGKRFSDEQRAEIVKAKREGTPNAEIRSRYGPTDPTIYRFVKEAEEAERAIATRKPGRPRGTVRKD